MRHGVRDVDLIVIVLDGQTNCATTLDLSTPRAGKNVRFSGKSFSILGF